MSVTRVAILISGGGSNMEALVRAMTGDHPARACLVLSSRADAGGVARAQALGVPTAIVDQARFGPDREAFESEIHAHLVGHGADLVCLAGFMRILSAGFIAGWEGRILNIHPSLLPKFRGLNTHARALEAGEAFHGCSVHEVTEVLDEGPILGQARVPVLPGETPESLAARVLSREHILYPAVLQRFVSGDRTPLVLDGSEPL